MKYGYFDDSMREYVITDPKTPVKWINYIGNLNFGGFVDQTGGSLICKGDPALNRIVRYIPQLPASDFRGETLYIRIMDENGCRVFSPYYVPTLDNYGLYECHVGLGYSRIISEFYGIRAESTIFVPPGDHRAIRDIKIKNMGNKPIYVDLIPVVEYSHFEALKQFTNADWVPQTMQSKIYDENRGLKILIQYAFMNRDRRINFFTSNHEISSFESDRKEFLGCNEYGSWKNPMALERQELGCCEALRGDNIGALMHHLGKVRPGEEKRIITQLGQCQDIEKEMSSINMFRDEKNVDKAFCELKNFWDKYLSRIKVNTPDCEMNTMLNIHNPRQCYITKNWSRYLSLYQLGFGARGIGFRDSSQDVMGIMSHVPEEGRELIEMLLNVQKRDGSAMHQFNPLTMEANGGDSKEMEDRPKFYGDDHLWIVLAVCEYIKETGNTNFLSKIIPFYDKDKMERPVEDGSVFEHLRRAVDFTGRNTGSHGLPLLGFADWNDTVNLPCGAESFFIANLYGTALREMIELCDFIGDKEAAKEYRAHYDSMMGKVNSCGWDGEWYIRYFEHDGSPIGSKDNSHGRIYVNGQSWPVISGFAPSKRAETALDSVNRMLNTSKGIKLSFPGYDGYDPQKGGITTYPPGAKENGGIFLHTNPWVTIAETILGRGDMAYEYYRQINPVCKNDVMEEYECEPYCYPQNILGDEHPKFGLARNSWLSGTASWTYQSAVKHILGIKPSYQGLKIDPCIPCEWEGFSVIRHFRGAVYDIEVRNPGKISKGVALIEVDGKPVKDGIIPVHADGKTHKVNVLMGKKR